MMNYTPTSSELIAAELERTSKQKLIEEKIDGANSPPAYASSRAHEYGSRLLPQSAEFVRA
jgi:hypothetical protein